MSWLEELVIVPNAAVIPVSAAFAHVSVMVRESASLVVPPEEQAARVKVMRSSNRRHEGGTGGSLCGRESGTGHGNHRFLFLVCGYE